MKAAILVRIQVSEPTLDKLSRSRSFIIKDTTMINNIILILSGLGIGSILGVIAKSFLDKQQHKFSKIFEYKEVRYKAIMILMWVAMNPSKYELQMLSKHRSDIKSAEDLDSELNLEYHNAMLFASDEVLDALNTFLKQKNIENWQITVRAMKKDLYI